MEEWTLKDVLAPVEGVPKAQVKGKGKDEWNLRDVLDPTNPTAVPDSKKEWNLRSVFSEEPIAEPTGESPEVKSTEPTPTQPESEPISSQILDALLYPITGLAKGEERMKTEPIPEMYKKAGSVGADLVPWVAGGAVMGSAPVSVPLVVGSASVTALLLGAKGVLDRYLDGKSKEPETGASRVLGGAGSWVDPRAESDMSESALVARDVLNVFPYVGGMTAIKGFGKGLSKVAPAVVKAGLQESLIPFIKKPSVWISEKITDPLWEGLVKGANVKLFPTSEKMMQHGHEESLFVKKSLAELMQPAIERFDSFKQGTFRNTTVLKSHLNKWGQDIGNVLAEESDPLIRHEISKGIRGTPISDLTTQRAKEVVEQFSNKLSDLGMKPKYENTFREEIGASIGKRLESPESVFTGGEFKSLLDPISESVAQQAAKTVGMGKLKKFIASVTPEEVGIGKYKYAWRKQTPSETLQKGLRELIGDPTIPYEFQTAAKDLHNLPATLPEEVAKSAKQLTDSMLTENIKRMPGVVLHGKPEVVLQELKASLKEGGLSPSAQHIIESKIKAIQGSEYLPSTWDPFVVKGRSLYVQRDVELELKAMKEIPEIANKAFNKYFMGPWKIAKVMMRPAAWGRNILTNLAQNHLGGLPFYRQDMYLKSYQGMRGSEGVKVEGKSVGSHWKDWNKATGSGGTFAMNDVVQLGEGMKYGSNMWERGLSAFDKIAAPAKTVYSAQEQLFKFAKYLHNIEGGMGQKEAAWDAMKWTFNYGEITRATAKVRSYAMPFFTWQSKVFPQVLEAVVKHPVKFAGLVTLYHGMQNAAIESAGMTAGEFEVFKTKMPEYLNNGLMMPMPWRDSQDRLNFLDLTYIVPGFGDAYQMSGHPMAQIFQHPLVSIAGGLQANKKYSGAPIWYDWEPATTKAAKWIGYIWEQLVPAPMPGGTDWRNMYQAFVETPMSEFDPTVRDLSRSQALAGSIGFKINPVDVGTAMQSSAALEKMKLSEIRSNLRKKLQSARSQDERQALVDKYSKYLLEEQGGSSEE